jgi:hypothetical protein
MAATLAGNRALVTMRPRRVRIAIRELREQRRPHAKRLLVVPCKRLPAVPLDARKQAESVSAGIPPAFTRLLRPVWQL